MSLQTDTNPDELTKRENKEMITASPVCSTPCPKGSGVCANIECAVKLRVESKSLNWWMFYPRCNGWGYMTEYDE